ncbi:MAG: hypothetical protein N2Z84_02400 [Atribacterota bacterium]|nr:hypothetical protein [Atribacterota bacterium]
MWPKISAGLVLFLVLGVFTGVVLAHPPSNINITFDVETQVLRVAIPHGVSDPRGDHYIDKVVVSLNGKEIITQLIGSQYSSQEQVVLYQLIDAQKGDKIGVYAKCNKFGDRTVTWEIK